MERPPPPSQREETLTRLQVVTLCGTAVSGCFILLVSFWNWEASCLFRGGQVRQEPKPGHARKTGSGDPAFGETGPMDVVERPGAGGIMVLAFIHFLDLAHTLT